MRKLISKEEAKDLVSKIREIEPLKLRETIFFVLEKFQYVMI